MDILTADGQFDHAVWYVLNQIQKQRRPYPNKRVYYYRVNINVKHRANFLYGMEYDAIQFLKAEKIIKEIGEPDDIRGGIEGTPSFECYEGHHFEALARFDEFYKLYTKKIGKLVNRGEWEEEVSRIRLVFDSTKDTVAYINLNGEKREDTFKKNTSEFRILSHLAQNKGVQFSTSKLTDVLKDARMSIGDADPKQRVIDKIKAIRNKLGKEVIISTPNGYVIDYEVVML
ncbi:MAG: hypothetical protein Q7S45_04625 [Candidatus Curtissbacteria bacterium]|nr:hypothetical protein [Candidatus Curtissbacteria bacterium]